MSEIIGYLDGYAARTVAPVETRTTVRSVSRIGNDFLIETDRGHWSCRNLVLASGACNEAVIPAFAAGIPARVRQWSPQHYRNPAQLEPGGTLIVGASATGVQLAEEIRAAGRDVILAVGNHIRMPRHYRGRDIQWWMDRSGVLSMGADDLDDLSRARSLPSLQLVGDPTKQFLDLNRLQAQGVEIVGRLADVRDGSALFSGSLANAAMLSDLKMNRALDGFDRWAEESGIAGLDRAERFEPTALPEAPRLSLDLARGRISNIIWATGFRPKFDWLSLPVFDRKGRLSHQQGIVAPGLYALGLPVLRTRKSTLIDGVGADALALADHLVMSRFNRAA